MTQQQWDPDIVVFSMGLWNWAELDSVSKLEVARQRRDITDGFFKTEQLDSCRMRTVLENNGQIPGLFYQPSVEGGHL